MKRIGIGVLVLGCTPQPDSADATPTPAAATADWETAQAEAKLSLPPSARAGMSSPPREQWACAFEVDENQGIVEHGRAVFDYGDRVSCRVPRSIVIHGVHGCPKSYERKDSDGLVRTRSFEYDAEGRMIAFYGNVTEKYAWDGDRLVSTTREQFGESEVATYRDDGERIAAIDAKGAEKQRLVLADDKLVELTESLYATAHVTWEGGRPSLIDVDVHGPIAGHVRRKLFYECPEASARVEPGTGRRGGD